MKSKRYKVLIADDEYWTREKIRKMIPWEDYDLDFLEPAEDGEEVLLKIDEEKPDILITDINMPFINGVELLKILAERKLELIAFVVSGYDDFEYVKDSFLSGAINYLVKPVSKIDLVNALVKALEIIGKRENEEKELKKTASLLQDREFSHLIERESGSNLPSMQMNNGLDMAGMTMVLIKLHNFRPSEVGLSVGDYIYEVKQTIRSLFESEDIIIFNNIYRMNEFIIVTDILQRDLNIYLDKIMRCLRRQKGIKLTIVVTEHSYSIASIHMAYVEAISLLMERKASGKQEILMAFGSSKEKEDNVIQRKLTKEQELLLKSHVKEGNTEGLKKVLFDTIGLSAFCKEDWYYLEIKQTLKQVLNILGESAYKDFSKEKILEFDMLVEQADKVVEQLEESVMEEYLENTLILFTSEDEESVTDSMKVTVQKIAKYIDENYNENLTLSGLAEQFYLDSTYLSKLFRRETGKNLVLYITDKRMEKAKKLMESNEINLTDVAYMVGYDDYAYFSRVFKKSTGVNPRKFRSREEEKNG